MLARDLTHRVGAFDFIRRFWIFHESLGGFGFRTERAQRLLDLRTRRIHSGLTLSRCGIRALLRHSDEKLAWNAYDLLNDCVVNAGFIDGCAQRLDRRRLLKPRRDHRSAFEVHTQVERLSSVRMKLVPVDSSPHSGQQQQNREPDKVSALAEPVNFYVLK